MKKIYFISGLPRSGNTLLSYILSQNPEIGTGGQSILTDIFHALNDIQKNSPRFLAWKDYESIDSLYKNIFNSYYANWNKEYIIERGDWITPYNFMNLQLYCPNEIKIVILVRDVLEIIKSYLKLCEKYPSFYINKQYDLLDKTTLYTSEMATKADLIMVKDGFVDLMLYSIFNLMKSNIDNFLFVEYDYLISNTKETIKEIYDFYNLPHYMHDFSKLNQLKSNNIEYDDLLYGAPLHRIKTDKIEKTLNTIQLEDSIVRKYSNLNFWRKDNKY